MEVAREAAWVVAIGGCHVAVSRSSKEAATEAQTSDQKSGRGGQQRMSHHNLDSSFCLQSFYSSFIFQSPPALPTRVFNFIFHSLVEILFNRFCC